MVCGLHAPAAPPASRKPGIETPNKLRSFRDSEKHFERASFCAASVSIGAERRAPSQSDSNLSRGVGSNGNQWPYIFFGHFQYRQRQFESASLFFGPLAGSHGRRFAGMRAAGGMLSGCN